MRNDRVTLHSLVCPFHSHGSLIFVTRLSLSNTRRYSYSYGYGFGALERAYYDASNQVFYGGSEIGFVSVSDFVAFPNITIADFGVDLAGETLTDIKACGEYLFVSTKDDPNPGHVRIYTVAKRQDDGTLSEPSLVQQVGVGVGPDNLLVKADCTLLVTADEGEGDYDDDVGLVNPPGSVSIVKGPFGDATTPPTVTTLVLDKWTDDELIAMGVHLPLSYNAMVYWNNPANNINFTAAIASYSSANVLEPEYLAWNGDETKVYVNLQENNAMVIVNVDTMQVESIHS